MATHTSTTLALYSCLLLYWVTAASSSQSPTTSYPHRHDVTSVYDTSHDHSNVRPNLNIEQGRSNYLSSHPLRNTFIQDLVAMDAMTSGAVNMTSHTVDVNSALLQTEVYSLHGVIEKLVESSRVARQT